MNFEMEYRALAGCYDDMTQDVEYSAWADFLETLFARSGRPVRTVLDLACGTGNMTCLLAQRGYELIGVDFSPEMLAVAAEKAAELPGEKPMSLCQPMEELDLYGTVDACVCLLDSVNHVTVPELLHEVFRRVWLFLEPGGSLIFDIHTPDHLQGLDGEMFLDETEDAFCLWRTEYDADSRICTYAMDIFQREGGLWRREEEIHQEYAYTPEEVEAGLHQAGFVEIQQYGECRLTPPETGAARIFFWARKPEG